MEERGATGKSGKTMDETASIVLTGGNRLARHADMHTVQAINSIHSNAASPV